VIGFVIEEAVLRRPLGGEPAMREQLQRLLESEVCGMYRFR
jgi:hypothetical protein